MKALFSKWWFWLILAGLAAFIIWMVWPSPTPTVTDTDAEALATARSALQLAIDNGNPAYGKTVTLTDGTQVMVAPNAQ